MRTKNPLLWACISFALAGVMILISVLAGSLAVLARAKAVEAAAETPQQLKGAYILTDVNVYSFVKHEGRFVHDGISWDKVVLVDPTVEGEFVKYHDPRNDSDHYFYRDTLTKVTEPVYEILPTAVSYARDESPISKAEPETEKWWTSNGERYIVGKFPTHGDRVYVDNAALWACPTDGKLRFFLRENLKLVNAGDLK